MATITIYDLSPAGLDLFSGSESYINELSENELDDVNGGFPFTIVVVSVSLLGASIGATIGYTTRKP
jgi:lactobin A/cerein 7B family class IIb bacteriocin